MPVDLTLRPMSTSQVLDRTFSLYRNNFVLFAGIAVLPPGLLLIGQLVLLMSVGNVFQGGMLGTPTPAPNIDFVKMGSGYLAYFGFMLVALIGYAFASGASVYAVSRVHMGNPATIAESYRLIRPHVWKILGIVVLAAIAAGLIFGIAAVVILVPLMLSLARGGGASTAFGATMALAIFIGVVLIIVGAVLLFFLTAKLALAVPACVLENLGVMDSMRRSWRLTEGTFWRLILVILVTAAMSWLLHMVLSIPYFIGIALMLTRKDPSILMPFLIWQYVAGFIASTLAYPVSTIAAALIYYDQRVRKEAFDLQLMMEALGQPAPPPLANPAVPGLG